MRNRFLLWLLGLLGVRAPVIVRYKEQGVPKDGEIVAFLQLPQWKYFMARVKKSAASEIAVATDKDARNDAALRYAGVERVESDAERYILEWQDRNNVRKDLFSSEMDMDITAFEEKHGKLVFVDG
jgi:hypothetical protein